MKPYEVTIEFQMFGVTIKTKCCLIVLNDHFLHALTLLGIHIAPF